MSLDENVEGGGGEETSARQGRVSQIVEGAKNSFVEGARERTLRNTRDRRSLMPTILAAGEEMNAVLSPQRPSKVKKVQGWNALRAKMKAVKLVNAFKPASARRVTLLNGKSEDASEVGEQVDEEERKRLEEQSRKEEEERLRKQKEEGR